MASTPLRSAAEIKSILLTWSQDKTKQYRNVEIKNFSSSWSSGLAFAAIVHNSFPESFDYNTLDARHRRKNFEIAFQIAEQEAGVYPMLDVDDMVAMKAPDPKCIFTYLQALHRALTRIDNMKKQTN